MYRLLTLPGTVAMLEAEGQIVPLPALMVTIPSQQIFISKNKLQ
jgi:hypothetical protein